MPEWWDRAVLLAAAAGLVVGALVSLVVIPFRRWRFETRVVEEVAAVPLDEAEARTVERLMEGLVIAAGCEAPRVLRCPTPALNAFAVGTKVDEAVLVVTDGMLLLPHRQLEAVLAYELGLIAGGEVRLTTWILVLTQGSDLSWLRLGLRSWALRTSALHRDRVAVSFTRDPGSLADAFAAVAGRPRRPRGARARGRADLVGVPRWHRLGLLPSLLRRDPRGHGPRPPDRRPRRGRRRRLRRRPSSQTGALG